MKEYVILKIDNNILHFNFKSISNDKSKFINKNTFDVDTLYYELKYYKKNATKIIELLKSKNIIIKELRIHKLITFKYVIELINSFNIEILTLNFLSTIDVTDYNLFLECNSLKIINCYFMSSDFKMRFINKGVIVNTSIPKEISSNFMKMQNLSLKDGLYYSKTISIKEEYPQLLDDLEEFLKINYKLKAINIYVYSKELISKIIDLVRNDESKNVIIYLHQETDKGNFIVNNFSWLKEMSKKCKKEFTCEFRIIYANSFISKNLFKQLTFNNLKLTSILCIYVCLVSLMIIKSYEYIEKISVDKLNASLSNVEEINSDDIDEIEEDEEVIEEEKPNNTQVVVPPKKEEPKPYVFEKSFNKLKKINNETVAYISIPNTQISYPVVQHSDNGYYLSRDFYKKKSSIGWIYLDYRNNINELNDNTIIYGHSMLNGTMFGTLKNVLDSSWRKKKENMIITIDTEKASYKFKIFSAYKVDYTTDYLLTSFESDEDKQEYIDMIQNRSLIDSNENIGIDDKIITLSTCTGNTNNNRRLVVHAVLIDDMEE